MSVGPAPDLSGGFSAAGSGGIGFDPMQYTDPNMPPVACPCAGYNGCSGGDSGGSGSGSNGTGGGSGSGGGSGGGGDTGEGLPPPRLGGRGFPGAGGKGRGISRSGSGGGGNGGGGISAVTKGGGGGGPFYSGRMDNVWDAMPFASNPSFLAPCCQPCQPTPPPPTTHGNYHNVGIGENQSLYPVVGIPITCKEFGMTQVPICPGYLVTFYFGAFTGTVTYSTPSMQGLSCTPSPPYSIHTYTAGAASANVPINQGASIPVTRIA